MTKYTLIGVLSCVAGVLLIGFQMLSSVMGSKAVWQNLSLVDVVGQQYFAEYMVTMPLFVLLFCIGGLFFVLDYFLGRR
jgi:hypothetical protein